MITNYDPLYDSLGYYWKNLFTTYLSLSHHINILEAFGRDYDKVLMTP